MTSEIIKRMFDACYQAKRTRICFRRCQKVSASFIQYLDVIQSLERKGIQVKVSDLAMQWSFQTGCYKNGQRNGRKRISSEDCFRRGWTCHIHYCYEKKAQNCHRNMTNNILTACFHIWKKYRRRCRMHDTDDRKILSDHV